MISENIQELENIDKFDFLLNESNIGTYNKCEIIEIFGIKKDFETPFNIFTLIVVEDTKQINIEGLMTEKLQKFQYIKDISWGLQRRIIDIDVAKKLYDDLSNKNIYKFDKQLGIGSLKLLQEQYIQSEDRFVNTQLNYILKNNFRCGSYILEFFDEDKNNCKFLLDEPKILNDFSEKLSEIIPINIGNLSDRLGNIIFQFPINNFKIDFKNIKQHNNKTGYNESIGIELEINANNSNFNIENFLIQVYEEYDGAITKQRLIEVKKKITTILFNDCFGTTIKVYDKTSEFLIWTKKIIGMKQMFSTIAMKDHQKRVFNIDGKIEKVEISHNQNSVYGKNKKEYDSWVRDRKYEQELKELEEKKSFIQYFGNQKNKALADIREIINKCGRDGVYLWDPYLSADDIKNTLYFSKIAYVPLRAITGLKQNSSKDEAKQEMVKKFNEDEKDFLFLNLEVRGKIDSNGYDFHDRFIIFPLETPKVWSLGISINQIGQSHHILQEVKNAQHILNAFNDLWEKLDKEECLVWKSK